jgi:hypothetical protein
MFFGASGHASIAPLETFKVQDDAVIIELSSTLTQLIPSGVEYTRPSALRTAIEPLVR